MTERSSILGISNSDIREYRKSRGVSIGQLSAALGRGFSGGRLSMVERGLLQLDSSELARLKAAIDRIAEIHSKVIEVKALASQIDLAKLCEDLRF
jgi:hypothetical protein